MMTVSGAWRDRRGNGWRVAGWGMAGSLLLLPLLAGAPWTASDYVFMAVLLGSVGVGIEIMIGRSGNPAYRAAAILGLAACFLLVWINAAVGMIGREGDAWNLMFAGVLVIAVAGSIAGRLRARAMARTMTVAAVAHLIAGGIGTFVDLRGGLLSMLLAVFWVAAAVLFTRAARQDEAAAAAPA